MISQDPSDTRFFKELVSKAKVRINRDKNKGIVYESKRRWDKQDELDFSKIPLSKLLDDPYYGGGHLWPEHRQDIIDLWEARKHGVSVYVTVEGIGSGKTHKFRNILRLLVLEVITKEDPFGYYGLDPTGLGISFVCMSRNAQLAKQVTFTTVLKAFDCPFFQEYFPPQVDYRKMEDNQRYPAMLRFPKSVAIFPGTGSALSAVGYNLYGGGVDEANYLEVVEDSKKAFVGRHYDAGGVMYEQIMARIKSRFVRAGGRLPGLLMLFSNPRYKGDFLERMILRARKGDRSIFWTRRCTWSAQPKSRFSGKGFLFDVANRKIVKDVV